MTSQIEDVIRESIVIWRKNKVLCVPYILEMLAAAFLMAACAVIVLVLLNPFKSADYSDPLKLIRSVDWALVAIDIFIALAFLLIYALTSAFLRSGAIGMANEAASHKKASIDDLFSYGSRKALSYFLATIILLIINIALLLVLIVPMLVLGSNVMSLASIILEAALSLTYYAVVLDGGAIKGIKKGFAVFSQNKIEVALLYVFTLAFSLIVYAAAAVVLLVLLGISLPFMDIENPGTVTWVLLGGIVSAAIILFILAQAYVIYPIGTVYWTKYYLSKTRGVKDD